MITVRGAAWQAGRLADERWGLRLDDRDRGGCGRQRHGDDRHSAASIAKMKAGHPLTDEDRRPWLGAVATWIDERAAAGRSGVIACSALKRSYRDQLLDGRPELRMVFLEVLDRETLVARLTGRHGHFFHS